MPNFSPSIADKTVIASGAVAGLSGVNKFGRNAEVDTAQAADIWEGAQGNVGNQFYNYPGFLSVAALINIASSDDEDGGAGTDTGALTLQMYGLDEDFLLQDEEIILNGNGVVVSANTYIRVFRLIVKTAGSVGWNIGKITATSAGAGTPRVAQIDPTFNQTTMAIYTVPADKFGFIDLYYGSINKRTSSAANIEIYTRLFGEVFQLKHVMGLSSVGSSQFTFRFEYPLLVQPKTDIKIRCGIPTQNDTDISAGFDFLLSQIVA